MIASLGKLKTDFESINLAVEKSEGMTFHNRNQE